MTSENDRGSSFAVAYSVIAGLVICAGAAVFLWVMGALA